MNFKPGDSVRLLHSTDAGRIVKIIDNKIAEVEIEEGFVIPVVIQELVPVSAEEKTEFDLDEITDEETSFVPAPKEPQIDDLMLAIEEIERGELRVTFINNSDFTILYSVFGTKAGNDHGIYKGIAQPRASLLLETCNKKELFRYPAITFQLIFFSEKAKKMPLPLIHEMKWELRDVLRKKHLTPLLGQKAAIVKFKQDLPSIDTEQLKEHLMGGYHLYDPSGNATKEGHEEIVVDLHIENLIDNPSSLSPGEMLEIQVKTFEKALDKAVLSDAKRIKFIHGLGNGTLRYTIHKKLSKSPLIRYFEDVEKSKFGYGATMIHFK